MCDKFLRFFLIFLAAITIFSTSGMADENSLPVISSYTTKQLFNQVFGAKSHIAIATQDIRGRFVSPLITEKDGIENFAIGVFDSTGYLMTKTVITPSVGKKYSTQKIGPFLMAPLYRDENSALFFSVLSSKNWVGKETLYFAIIKENGGVNSLDTIAEISFKNLEEYQKNSLIPYGFELTEKGSQLLYRKGKSFIKTPLPRNSKLTGYLYPPQTILANSIKVKSLGPIPRFNQVSTEAEGIDNFSYLQPKYRDARPDEITPHYELKEGVNKLKSEHKEAGVTFMQDKKSTLVIIPNPASGVHIMGIGYSEE